MSGVWDEIEAVGLARASQLADHPAKDCRKELFARVSKLAELGLCARNAAWWVDVNTVGNAFAVTLSHNADGRLGSHACIRVNGLEHLADGALLAFGVHVDPSETPKAEYSAGLVGRVRATGADWFARIDAAGTGEGVGRCSHPIQHAHVGTDPDSRFQARVPVHPLTPWEAVDWLLATADSRFEPCPHA